MSTDSKARYTVTCTSFRPFERDTLKGFATVLVEPPGLLMEVDVREKPDGKGWVGLPAKPFTDASGATKYKKLVDFQDSSEFWKFNAQALAAIKAFRAGGDKQGDDGIPF